MSTLAAAPCHVRLTDVIRESLELDEQADALITNEPQALAFYRADAKSPDAPAL